MISTEKMDSVRSAAFAGRSAKKAAALTLALSAACAHLPFRAAPDAPPTTGALARPLPEGESQASLAAAMVAAWGAWRRRFLITGPCGKDRTYVDSSQDSGQDGSITVSEAHGWGMLLLTMMAPFEPEAHALFDNMVRFLADHPSTTGSGLMAWDVHAGCRTPKEATSATDGDLDIALALLNADELWGSRGPIDYRALAMAHIERLRRHEAVFAHGYMALWEDIAPGAPRFASCRTSDFMMGHFRAFFAAEGEAGWRDLVDRGYGHLARLAEQGGSGFLPDFAIHLDAAAEPAPARFLERDLDGGFGYNACRLPLRLGQDAWLHGDRRGQALASGIVAAVAARSGGRPDRVRDGYRLDGTAVGASARLAFVAPLTVAAMVSPGQEAFFTRLYRHLRDAPLEFDAYYGNTLRMLALVTVAGHWREPGVGRR